MQRLSEAFRVYVFPGGDEVVITGPILLEEHCDGSHLLLDHDNIRHQVQPGWIHLYTHTAPAPRNSDACFA